MLRKTAIKRQLTSALILCLAAGPVPAQTAITERLPDIGEISGNVMTPTEEARLGKAFMRSVRRSLTVVDDPMVIDYLQYLGRKLASNSTGAAQDFSFFLIDSPEINAFAGPAGHIGVYTGLVLTAQTESEVAAVVAHEIAHVTQAHLRRTWQAASNLALPNAAVLLAAIVLGATVGGDAGIAAAAAGQASLLQQQINFTRANEQEADRVGIGILAAADFEPRAMATFFERLGRATRGQSTEVPEFLRTHPVTTSRIADAQGRAEDFSRKQRPEDLRFHLLRAELRQRQIVNPREALKQFERALSEGRYRERDAERFGYVRALMRNDRLAEARTQLDELQAKHPRLPELIIVSAQLHQLLGQPERGIRELQDALALLPTSYSLSLTMAELLLTTGKYSDAYDLMHRQLALRPTDARLNELAARAAAGAGNKSKGHELMAEYYYLMGELKPAVLQLEIALRDTQLNFYDSSRLEARLRAFREEVKEMERREKKR